MIEVPIAVVVMSVLLNVVFMIAVSAASVMPSPKPNCDECHQWRKASNK